jgi:ATPase family protein associated with various cellular activities (AAA)/winged helix domain-containing protein
MATNGWRANRRYLAGALVPIRRALEQYVGAEGEAFDADDLDPAEAASCRRDILDATGQAPPLDRVREVFGLSNFECAVLLLCAGIELDGRFAPLCARAPGHPDGGAPTFALALAAFAGPEWGALLPTRPLRRWRLIHAADGVAPLTRAPLRVDEAVLHFLSGYAITAVREVESVIHEPVPDNLPPSHEHLVRRLAAVWTDTQAPVIQLCGQDQTGKRAIAARVCAMFGRTLGVLTDADIPSEVQQVDEFAAAWERDAALGGPVLLVDCHNTDSGDPRRLATVLRLVRRLAAPIVVATPEQLDFARGPLVTVDVPRPTASEQGSLWSARLGSTAASVRDYIEAVQGQFSLSAAEIDSASVEAIASISDASAELQAPSKMSQQALGAALWESARMRARPRLADLAQRVEALATWGDLVLPERTRQLLSQVALNVQRRPRVYEEWGFAAQSARGLGISALFAGPSGTGKTMAAEALAHELRLDLYRIDLSATVSKYIGETEKNLRRIFDAADQGGAVLLFDEADALFGKRSDVKDAHDRYANVEVSYLLQRMETYRGLAILTSNREQALDSAFLRRIRFVVRFPFPDVAERAEIWRRAFPSATPVDGIDIDKLARLNLAGGHIHSIAMQAAFLAAGADQPVSMDHLRMAARTEYEKLQRPFAVELSGVS